MGENRNRRNKRKSKNSLSNRMALIGITVVVASLAVVVHIGGASLRERDLEYQAPVSYTHLVKYPKRGNEKAAGELPVKGKMKKQQADACNLCDQ